MFGAVYFVFAFIPFDYIIIFFIVLLFVPVRIAEPALRTVTAGMPSHTRTHAHETKVLSSLRSRQAARMREAYSVPPINSQLFRRWVKWCVTAEQTVFIAGLWLTRMVSIVFVRICTTAATHRTCDNEKRLLKRRKCDSGKDVWPPQIHHRKHFNGFAQRYRVNINRNVGDGSAPITYSRWQRHWFHIFRYRFEIRMQTRHNSIAFN